MTSTIEDVKRDYRYVLEFGVEYITGLYKRCEESRKALSATMGVDFKAVYRHERERANNKWTDGDVSWCGEVFYAVNPKGKVISFHNSEWGGVERHK